MKATFDFGSDSIASYFLKVTFPVFASSLCKIFNFYIETGDFPNAWKEHVQLQSSNGAMPVIVRTIGKYRIYLLCPSCLKK